MTRGTTPTIKFNTTGINTANISKISIVFNQYGINIIEKTLSDVTRGNNFITVHLTEAETLKLDENKEVEMQIRCEILGEKLASNIVKTTVNEILKGGIL